MRHGLATAAACLLLPRLAVAHAMLTYPAPRALAAPGIKLTPFSAARATANSGCGGAANTGSNLISIPQTAFRPGATVNVRWRLTIPHPLDNSDTGVRVAVHYDDTDSFSCNIVAGGLAGDPGFVVPASVVPAGTGDEVRGEEVVHTITLPNKLCNRCVLQWAWAARRDGGYYMSCADIAITQDGQLPGSAAGAAGVGAFYAGLPGEIGELPVNQLDTANGVCSTSVGNTTNATSTPQTPPGNGTLIAPPLGTGNGAISVTLIMAGSIDTLPANFQSTIATNLANMLTGVSASNITVQLSAASVHVVATISAPTDAIGAAARATLASQTRVTLSMALGVNVEQLMVSEAEISAGGGPAAFDLHEHETAFIALGCGLGVTGVLYLINCYMKSKVEHEQGTGLVQSVGNLVSSYSSLISDSAKTVAKASSPDASRFRSESEAVRTLGSPPPGPPSGFIPTNHSHGTSPTMGVRTSHGSSEEFYPVKLEGAEDARLQTLPETQMMQPPTVHETQGPVTSVLEDASLKMADDDVSAQAEDTTANLPAQWQAAFDDSSGAVYFFNSMTGESQWERPGGGDDRQSIAMHDGEVTNPSKMQTSRI
jgi:hypothetical protein